MKTGSTVNGGKTLIHLIAAAFAFAAAGTANGAWRAWQATTSPAYWEDAGNWYNSGNSAYNAAWNINTALKPYSERTIYFKSAENYAGTDLRVDSAPAGEPVVFAADGDNPGYGIKSQSPLRVVNYTDADAYLELQSGTYTFLSVNIGDKSGSGATASLKVSGAALKCASTSGNSYLSIGRQTSGTAIMTVTDGGSYDNLGSSNGNTVMCYNSDCSATLDINGGGTVTLKGPLMMNYVSSAIGSTVNVSDGGVLTLTAFQVNYPGTSGATVTIDGGTVKAYDNNAAFLPDNASLRVFAGADGATIDTDGHAVTIAAAIEDKSGEAGKVRFTGGGTATLSGIPAHTGGTTVEAGTVLALTSAAKAAMFANSVTVEIPAAGTADGQVVFKLTDGGAFTQSEFEAISVSGAESGRYALVLSDNDAKVVVSDTLAGEYVWNGGDSAASWRASGKWSKNGIAGDWYDFTAAVFETAGDAANVDSAVAAASIAFRANATVTGSETLTVPSVSVASGISAEISAPTAGSLVKDGPGTLTLSAGRSAVTTISEGTLVMSGSETTLDWGNVTLGTESGKAAILKFENGATLASSPSGISLGAEDGGLEVELHKGGGVWNVAGRLVVGWNDGDAAKFIHNGGAMAVTGQMRVTSQSGSSGEFTMNDGAVTVGGNLYVGCNDGTGRGVFNMNGGTFSCSGTTYIPYGNTTEPAELYINGGTFTAAGPFVAGNTSGSVARIELGATEGVPGVLETKGLTLGTGTASLVFNGGELKASGTQEDGGLIAAGITVVVGANGGTVNANGMSVTIPAVLGAPGETGGIAFTGGGTVALSAAPAYDGATIIEIGTVLSVPVAIAGEDLVFTIPEGLATGLYKVAEVTGGGAFDQNILSSATLPNVDGIRFFLENDDKEIWCVYSSNPDDHIWIGGAAGALDDGANWLSGNVPAGGTAFFGTTSAATLVNPDGSAFAATAIVFASASAKVTFTGAEIRGLTSIVNNGGQHHVFECPVSFASGVAPSITLSATGYMEFPGGATMDDIAAGDNSIFKGKFTVNKSGDYTLNNTWTLASDSEFLWPNATWYSHNGRLTIESGAKMTVKATKQTGGGTASTNWTYLLNRNDGTFIVTEDMNPRTAPRNKGFLTSAGGSYLERTYGDGVFFAEKLRIGEDGLVVAPNKIVLGSGGILRGSGLVRVMNSGTHYFGSAADWSMRRQDSDDASDPVIYKFVSSQSDTITFDTKNYTNDAPQTIYCKAPICAEDAATAPTFSAIVKGNGAFVFECTYNDTSDWKWFSGGLAAQDSVTVEVMPNACPGKGAVTMNGTSTLLLHTGGSATTGDVTIGETAVLSIAGTGAATLGGALTLADGATLKFTASGDSCSKLTAANGFSAAGAVKVKVDVGDGRLNRGNGYEIADFGATDISAVEFTPAGENADDFYLEVQGSKLILKSKLQFIIRVVSL